MSSRREWPENHTNVLLDYVDEFGHTLATPGPRRREGYKKLRKHLNSACVPRPRPFYSIEDISAHCCFLTNKYAVVVGPNVKEFFKSGRTYLHEPFNSVKSHVPALFCVNDAASDTISRNQTDTRGSMMPIQQTPIQSLTPSLQNTQSTFSITSNQQCFQDVRPTRVNSWTYNCSPCSSQTEDSTLYQETTGFSSESWDELCRPRSVQHRISFQAIGPAMIRLERYADRATDSYMESGEVSLLPPPDAEYIKRNHQSLAELLASVVPERNMAALATGEISNVLLLRSLIGWAVYKWVFQDPFPVLGTERGGIWDDLTEMLKERGGDFVISGFEKLRIDLQFRLSQKPQLLEETLPARADQLARQLADILEPLFLTHDVSGQKALLSKDQEPRLISNDWIPSLGKAFLQALEILVKLRQKQYATEFCWPEIGASFDKRRMETENNGTKLDFEYKPVLLALMPAAISWIPSIEREGELEELMYYPAQVVLDMGNGL